MAVEISITEAGKNYVELLLKALKTNERFAGTQTRLVHFTKEGLGEDGSTLYKQAFDAGYDKKLVEKPIVALQITLVGRVLGDCTVDNVGKLSEGYLAKKYGDFMEKGWGSREVRGQLKRYVNTLPRFLLAFVAVLQKRVKENKGYFAELGNIVVAFKEKN